METDLVPKLAAGELLAAQNIGTQAWWKCLQQQGTPLVFVNYAGDAVLDFFWQDPEGTEQVSQTQQVLLQINSVTDHHSWEPESLRRIVGTDVWHRQVCVNASWRGSYSFIPLQAHQCPSLALAGSDGSSEAQRAWYISIMDLAQADPCNLSPVIQSYSAQASALHLPKAEQELGWPLWDNGTLAPELVSVHRTTWHSQTLANQRDVWFFETGQPSNNKPLVILLDGQKWCPLSGAPAVIHYLTNQEQLQPAQYLLIDSIGPEARWQELSCYEPFWQAIFSELIPSLSSFIKGDLEKQDVLVAGQSLGGLSALYAGLYWPKYINKVVSLSGSFWWPDVDRKCQSRPDVMPNTPPNSLAERLQLGSVVGEHLEVFMSVGTGEGDMNLYNDILFDALKKQQVHVTYEHFCGGHDWLPWRGSLMKGLTRLLPFNGSTLRN